MAPLMKMYAEGRKGADFEHGIEAAVEAILVSPDFLFMRESDPPKSAAGDVHRISDLELATRLSFFLWSSIPDEQLLSLAREEAAVPARCAEGAGRAHAGRPQVQGADRQLRRPVALSAPAGISEARPPGLSRTSTSGCATAMLTETQMFFDGVVRDNRSALDFLDADYTYVNQRLAEHYGIPGVYGTSFRKVKLDPAQHRGGLLGQGAILTVTSYNNRTSVVLRGKWILENLLAAAAAAAAAAGALAG